MDDGLLTGFLAGQADSNNNGGNGNGWGGGWGDWIVIILFAMIFGWGGNGFGGGFGSGNGFQGALTRADLCQDMNFGQLENGVRGIQQGICDSTFALNNTIVNGFAGVNSAVCSLGYEQAQLTNGVNMNMMQGFNAANVVALQNQNALQTQLAECLKKIFKKAKKIFCTDNFYAVGTCAA